MYTESEILDFVRDEDVKFIRLAFFTLNGKQKNTSIMANQLTLAFKNGVSFDASSIPGFQGSNHSDLSIVRDYPVRGRKMTFHVKRRRWIDVETGKSVSKRWDIVAEGTRFSKEFVAFLKDMLGQIPDYGPLS